jgi:hypothetical protein
LSIGIKQYVTVAMAVALSLVCLVVVLETSGPVEPTVGVSSVMSKVSWLNERRLIGLGIIVLTLALTVLILWKLPMRPHLGAEAWGTFVSGNHQTPWRASTNEVIGGPKVATPQLPMASSESVDEPLAKGQAEHLDFSAGGMHARRKLLRCSQTPLSRKRMGCTGWATGVHSPEVRRALKRMRETRGYRGAVPIARTRRCEHIIRGSQVRVLPSAVFVQQPCSNPGEYPEILRKLPA